MGTYYYLQNDSKKETVELDGYIKHGPLTLNPAVHYALINYMMDNQGDSMRMLSDMHEVTGYKKIDLLHYSFQDEEVGNEIKRKLGINELKAANGSC